MNQEQEIEETLQSIVDTLKRIETILLSAHEVHPLESLKEACLCAMKDPHNSAFQVNLSNEKLFVQKVEQKQ